MDETDLLGVNLIGQVIGLAANLTLNAVVMYVVANWMMSLGEKIPLRKCFLGAFLLVIVSVVALACLAIPIPFLNFAIALVVFYKGAIAAIEGAFDMVSGGFTFLVIYILISLGLAAALRSLAA